MKPKLALHIGIFILHIKAQVVQPTLIKDDRRILVCSLSRLTLIYETYHYRGTGLIFKKHCTFGRGAVAPRPRGRFKKEIMIWARSGDDSGANTPQIVGMTFDQHVDRFQPLWGAFLAATARSSPDPCVPSIRLPPLLEALGGCLHGLLASTIAHLPRGDLTAWRPHLPL